MSPELEQLMRTWFTEKESKYKKQIAELQQKNTELQHTLNRYADRQTKYVESYRNLLVYLKGLDLDMIRGELKDIDILDMKRLLNTNESTEKVLRLGYLKLAANQQGFGNLMTTAKFRDTRELEEEFRSFVCSRFDIKYSLLQELL